MNGSGVVGERYNIILLSGGRALDVFPLPPLKLITSVWPVGGGGEGGGSVPGHIAWHLQLLSHNLGIVNA